LSLVPSPCWNHWHTVTGLTTEWTDPLTPVLGPQAAVGSWLSASSRAHHSRRWGRRKTPQKTPGPSGATWLTLPPGERALSLLQPLWERNVLVRVHMEIKVAQSPNKKESLPACHSEETGNFVLETLCFVLFEAGSHCVAQTAFNSGSSCLASWVLGLQESLPHRAVSLYY
jgi:hypothetical protein